MIADDRRMAHKALREFRVLQKLGQAIYRFCSSGEPAPGEGRSEVRKDLQRFKDHLACLFKLEEEGRLFEDMLARLPMEDREIERLRGEHQILLEGLQEVIDRIDLVDGESYRNDVKSILESLRRHEDAENELLLRAHYNELGTCD